MNLHQYQKETVRTLPDLGSLELNLLHMKMGIHTEIGEAVDMLKKHIAYGKPFDVVNLQEEIADTCWYLSNEMVLQDIFILEDNKDFDFLYKGFATVSTKTDLANALMDFLELYNDKSNTYYDLFLSLFVISSVAGLDFWKGLDNNIDKLRKRFPDKFTSDLAINRDVAAERLELEK